MKLIIQNCPLQDVWTAFQRAFPDHPSIRVIYDPEMQPPIEEPEDLECGWGYTNFDPGGEVTVALSMELHMFGLVEIFAHELAHSVTPEDNEHGEVWMAAFDKIHQAYEALLNERENVTLVVRNGVKLDR